MKKNWFLLYLLTVSGFCAQAQTVLTGWVTDKANKEPIGGAAVTLHDKEGETIAYDITNQDGSFIIDVKSQLSQLTLQVRFMGYEEVKRNIENKTQQLFIEMSFGEIALREVVVKSSPMWNREDTLVYSVDAFISVGDKSIGDLLKKLPGVEVSASGGIKYQGEAINKFYIEGLDLLERRYGIATNNIPVDAVQNVEIIENHQPVQTLRDAVVSDKAAVNLRLRKDRMSRPVGTVTLGAGYSDEMLWLAEAFALSAGREQQFIVMYKTNNAAKDISTELTAQTLSSSELDDVSGYSRKTLFNARSSNYPPLEKKRYLFNNSHVVSTNSLWKTGEYAQFRLNMQYQNNAIKENISHNSEYLFPDGTLQIKETSTHSSHANVLDAVATFTNNSPRFYLNNALSWSGSWDKSFSSIVMNGMGVHQQFNLPSQLVKNDLKLVKKWGKRLWDITSFAVYSSQPQLLEVSVDTVDINQSQQVNLSGLYTRNSTYYSFGFRNSSIVIKGAFEASFDRYISELSHPVFRDSIRSNITSNYSLLELIPTYMYRSDKLSVNADVALKNYYLSVSSSSNHSYFLPNSSIRFNYRFSTMLTARAGYQYTQSIGDFFDLTDVYFMKSYRSFGKQRGILSLNKRQSFSTSLQYRNPLTTFFFNTSLLYAPSANNTVTTQHFVGNEVVGGNKEQATHSNLFLWSGYAGKYFSEIRTNFSLNVNYTSMKGERQQQKVLYPFKASGWAFIPKLNIKFSDATSVSYQTMASNRITEIIRSNDTFRSSMWQITQQLSAYYLLGKKWQFNGRLEHSYNEISENNSVNMFFADVGITFKHAQFEFNLSTNNLFNEKSYSYSIFSGLDRFDYEYKLRPRMLLLSVSYNY